MTPALPKPLRFDQAPQKPKDVQNYHIRFIRDKFGLSQRELADIIGLSEQSIRGWENNMPIGAPSRMLIVLMFKNPAQFGLVEKKPSKS